MSTAAMSPRAASRRRVVAWVLATLGLAACQRVPLRPGTGGLRVHVRGLREGQRATVSMRAGPPTPQRRAITMATTNGNALFVDMAPDFYDVVAYTDDGRGGIHRPWSGSGARIEAGRVADVDIDPASGIAVVGRVLDAITGEPLAAVDVQPPPHVASVTWPSELPGLWAETRTDGTFAIGGLEAYAPVAPGATPGPRVAAWLTFARDGYVSQRWPLDPPGGPSPRHVEIRLVRAVAGDP